MSETMLVAIVAAMPALVAAMVSWWNARQIRVVHDAVNGGLTAAREEVRALKQEVRALKRERARTRKENP